MAKEIKVHIFSQKPNICGLIKKTFSLTNYVVTCTDVAGLDNNFLDHVSDDYDCIIIDNELDRIVKEKIKLKYRDIPMICLPSLETEACKDGDMKYIPEPLRLSELAKILDEIFADQAK